MRAAALAPALLLVSACSSNPQPLQVVDSKGNPIANALVIAERPPFIGQAWQLSADATNANGMAQAFPVEVTIFAKGYYPIIEGERERDSGYSPRVKGDDQRVVLYPLNEGLVIAGESQFIEQDQLLNNGFYQQGVALTRCPQVTLAFDSQKKQLHINSRDPLWLSDDFYFANAGKTTQQLSLDWRQSASFYCQQDTTTSQAPSYQKVKITLSRSGDTKTLNGIRLYQGQVTDLQQPLLPAQNICTDNYWSLYGEVAPPSQVPKLAVSSRFISAISDNNHQQLLCQQQSEQQHQQQQLDLILSLHKQYAGQ